MKKLPGAITQEVLPPTYTSTQVYADTGRIAVPSDSHYQKQQDAAMIIPHIIYDFSLIKTAWVLASGPDCGKAIPREWLNPTVLWQKINSYEVLPETEYKRRRELLDMENGYSYEFFAKISGPLAEKQFMAGDFVSPAAYTMLRQLVYFEGAEPIPLSLKKDKAALREAIATDQVVPSYSLKLMVDQDGQLSHLKGEEQKQAIEAGTILTRLEWQEKIKNRDLYIDERIPAEADSWQATDASDSEAESLDVEIFDQAVIPSLPRVDEDIMPVSSPAEYGYLLTDDILNSSSDSASETPVKPAESKPVVTPVSKSKPKTPDVKRKRRVESDDSSDNPPQKMQIIKSKNTGTVGQVINKIYASATEGQIELAQPSLNAPVTDQIDITLTPLAAEKKSLSEVLRSAKADGDALTPIQWLKECGDDNGSQTFQLSSLEMILSVAYQKTKFNVTLFPDECDRNNIYIDVYIKLKEEIQSKKKHVLRVRIQNQQKIAEFSQPELHHQIDRSPLIFLDSALYLLSFFNVNSLQWFDDVRDPGDRNVSISLLQYLDLGHGLYELAGAEMMTFVKRAVEPYHDPNLKSKDDSVITQAPSAFQFARKKFLARTLQDYARICAIPNLEFQSAFFNCHNLTLKHTLQDLVAALVKTYKQRSEFDIDDARKIFHKWFVDPFLCSSIPDHPSGIALWEVVLYPHSKLARKPISTHLQNVIQKRGIQYRGEFMETFSELEVLMSHRFYKISTDTSHLVEFSNWLPVTAEFLQTRIANETQPVLQFK